MQGSSLSCGYPEFVSLATGGLRVDWARAPEDMCNIGPWSRGASHRVRRSSEGRGSVCSTAGEHPHHFVSLLPCSLRSCLYSLLLFFAMRAGLSQVYLERDAPPTGDRYGRWLSQLLASWRLSVSPRSKELASHCGGPPGFYPVVHRSS